jgi:flagellar basal-body rod protein FlgG
MLRSLYTAATGMEAQETKMDIIAHNLANTSTVGYKKVRAEFEDLFSETLRTAAPAAPNGGTAPSPVEIGLGVRTAATTRSISQGDMLNTGNQLDVAIQGGQGFFEVQRANGEPGYTRAGNFRVDSTGRLVTQEGEQLEPSITVPQETTSLIIGGDGQVSAKVQGKEEPTVLGQLELVTFPNSSALEAVGGNIFLASAASGDPLRVKPGEGGTGSLAQGFLEGANVKAVEEMIAMISTQRAYEMNSKVIMTADQMLQKLTSLR